jgi:(p)ppGpp synthase/HD superfamily hydrolase
LERALYIAAEAHKGQQDRYGMPYLMHVQRVAAAVPTPFEKVCALLHDVVEDTHWNLDGLRREGFTPEVLGVLATLTKAEGEAYDAYIERVKLNPLALRIKLADLTDNLDLKRAPAITADDVARINRYLKAHREIAALIP